MKFDYKIKYFILIFVLIVSVSAVSATDVMGCGLDTDVMGCSLANEDMGSLSGEFIVGTYDNTFMGKSCDEKIDNSGVATDSVGESVNESNDSVNTLGGDSKTSTKIVLKDVNDTEVFVDSYINGSLTTVDNVYVKGVVVNISVFDEDTLLFSDSTTTDNKGRFYFTVPNPVLVDSKNVRVFFEGNSNYDSSQSSAVYSVVKLGTVVRVENLGSNPNKTVTLTAYIKSKKVCNEGTVTFIINDTDIATVSVCNGVARYDYVISPDYELFSTIKAIYSGSDYYNSSYDEGSVVIRDSVMHVLNQNSLMNVFKFDEDGEGGTFNSSNVNVLVLSDNVIAGDTVDIQGKIILNETTLTINKGINIISSTKDAYICLNTTSGSLFGEAPGSSFVINRGGSYSNVTGIYFFNTQLWLTNTTYVTLDNISAVVKNRRVGSGVGQTAIRENSTYVILKNSYIYTENNGGSTSIALSWADYCTLENNTVVGNGTCGNLIYINTYNIYLNIAENQQINIGNKILNNTLYGPETVASICYGICLTGTNNTVSGNKIYYGGCAIQPIWGADPPINAVVTDNEVFLGGSINTGAYVANNIVHDGGSINLVEKAVAFNNTASKMTFDNNTRAFNNTVNGTVTVNGEYVELSNNIFSNLIIKNSNAEIIYNSIGNLTVSTDYNNVSYNNIIGDIKVSNSYNNLDYNNITGNITVSSSNTHIGFNDIVGTVYLDKQNTLVNNTINGTVIALSKQNTISNNTIRNDGFFTIKASGENNIIFANVLSAGSLVGLETLLINAKTTVYDNYPENDNLFKIILKNVTDFKYGENIYLSAHLDYIIDSYINFTVLGDNGFNESYLVLIDNKNAILTLDKLNIGSYIVTANLVGTDSSENISFNVNKNDVKFSYSALTVNAYPNSALYKFTLKDASNNILCGKTITVVFNGKTFDVVTNNNGVASFKVSLSSAKTYSLVAKFKGDKYYNGASFSSSIKVIKNNVKFSKATKKVKKSNSKSTFMITLTTINGKVLKNKKLVLTINKKKFTVKTNAKGVAVFKVLLPKKKKTYNYTVSFSGDSGNYKKTLSSKLVVY